MLYLLPYLSVEYPMHPHRVAS